MDDFGATDRPASLDGPGLDACRAALQAIPGGAPPLYARVDLLRDNGGSWILTELELVEPSLFFRHCPGSAAIFATAVQKRVTDGPGDGLQSAG